MLGKNVELSIEFFGDYDILIIVNYWVDNPHLETG